MKIQSKELSIVLTITIILIFACLSRADVPGPPANQSFGLPDTIFNNLVEGDCRACHDYFPTSNVDRHHLLYGDLIPLGDCSVNRNECLSDRDCFRRICSSSGERCDIDEECPDYGLGETCGEVCIGESVIPFIDADQDGVNDTLYSCLSCHEVEIVDAVKNFLVERDCLVCHVQIPGEGSVHHLTPLAQGDDSPSGNPAVGDCTPCHGTLVDDIGDGHTIPSYDPSMITPEPGGGNAGACDYCHDEGLEGGGVQVFTNQDTHHNTGVYVSETGVINDTKCLWCHNIALPDQYDIRTCEGCHGLESLHNIQVDSPNAGNPGTIVVGEEDYGYGHVGADNPGAGSDCWGCHGFTIASAPSSGPVTPYISSSDVLVITTGTDTAVTLTGSAFINVMGATQFFSEIALTSDDGSSVNLVPDTITQDSLTVTIPGTTVPGNYTLQAAKDENTISNPLVLSIKPEVVINKVVCSKCMGTMTITGAGFSEKPEGSDDYISVEEGERSLNIISWTDTRIEASAARCSGTVTVNALFGSAQE